MKQTTPQNRQTFTATEYTDLYEMLLEAFIRKEWPDTGPTPGRKFSVWLKPGKNESRVRELFQVGPEYFYDRYSRAKNHQSIGLEERLVVAVLDYIDVNGRTITELLSNFYSSTKRPSRKINGKTSAIAPAETDVQVSEWDDVIETVLRFYAAVDAGRARHHEAWDCLTPRLKHSICESDFERFCEGYTNTVAIKNIKVFNVIKNANKAVECSVYYIDEIRNYRSKDLSGWDEYTVADLMEFVEKVKKVEATVIAAGGRDFNKLELYKLFEPAASEYIWYKCRIKPENIDKAFTTHKATEIKRLYRVTCKQVDGNWLIDTIRLLNVHSSR